MKKLFTLLILNLALFTGLKAQTCGTPTGLGSSSVMDFTATITCTAVPGAISYNTRHRIAAGPGAWVNGSSATNSKNLINLTPGTTYDFQFQANCSSGLSAWSATSQFLTTANCTIPTGISTTSLVPTSATLTWNPVGAAIYYSTRYRTLVGPGAWVTGSTGGNTKALSGLTQGTWYEFQVQTNCTGGQTGYSASYQFLTPCATTAMTNTAGTYSKTRSHSDNLSLEYNDSVGCVNIARVIDSVGGNVLGSTTVTSVLSANPQSGVYTDYIVGRRKTTIAPASNGQGRIVLYFSQADFTNYNANNNTYLDLPTSGSNSDPNIPRLKIARLSGSTWTNYNADSTKWNSTNSRWEVYLRLSTVGGDYYFYTMPDCIGITVSGLNVTNVLGTSFTANWNNVSTPAFGWYSIQYKPTSSGTWINGGTANNGVLSKVLIGLTPNTNYEVQVRRHCSNLSEGDWSSSVYFTTANSCYTPTGVFCSNQTATSFKVNWTSVPGALFSTIRHRLNAGPGAWTSGTSTGNSKTIGGLSAGTVYDVEVGTNCAGWLSPYSTMIQCTTASSRPSAVIENEIIKTDFELFPNPVQDQLTIRFSDDQAQGYEAFIADMSGRIIKNIHIQSAMGLNNADIDLQSIQPGVYSIKILNKDQISYHAKFTKQ